MNERDVLFIGRCSRPTELEEGRKERKEGIGNKRGWCDTSTYYRI